jgi:WD40 repeat protein
MLPRCPIAIALFVYLSAASAQEAPKDKPLGKGVRCVAFSPDGALVAAGFGEPKERGRVAVWDVAKKTLLWSHAEDEGAPTVHFSPNGKTLAFGTYGNKAKLIEAATGRVTKVLEGHAKYVRAVAFSPDGKTLATGGWDLTVRLWDLASGEEKMKLEWPEERLYTVSFSPGGQWLLAAGEQTRIWDAATGAEKRTVKPYFAPSAVFAGDDWFLTGGWDGTIRL